MIVTFKQETVDFWKEEGFQPELRFEESGFRYWSIDVPADHALLTSPAYLALIIGEQREYPEVICKRFRPPMYTVIVNGRVAMTPCSCSCSCSDSNGYAMPIARDIRLLHDAFTRPDKGQTPQYLKLKRTNQIVNAMREVRQFGVRTIAFYVNSEVVETFKLDTVARFVSGGKYVVTPEATSRDEEVQPVCPPEDVQPGGAG